MTVLTTVGHAPPAQREGTKRQSSRDFAQALAKDHETTSQGRLQAGSPDEAHAVSTRAKAISKAPLQTRVSAPAVTGASAPDHPSAHAPQTAIEGALLAVAVTPVGMTEALQYARVFGVHLLPDSYLSEVAVRDAIGSETAPVMAGDAASEQTLAPVLSPQANALPIFMADGDEPSPVQQASFATVGTAGEVELSPDADTVSPSSVAQSSGASALIWSERTIRITGEREGHAVAWIRDYRLDGHDEERLVHAVLHEARVQGVMLRQVIVNGHEAWASREAICKE